MKYKVKSMYRIKLQCDCGHQSDWKEYDVPETKMKQIINIAKRALRLPQYLICPRCCNVMLIKPVVEKIN